MRHRLLHEGKSNKMATERPYFIWDYDINEEQVWEILRGDNETRKVWLISRILQYARWDDIWKYLTLDDVREYFDRIHWRFPFIKDIWAHALEVWNQKDWGLTEFYLAHMMRQVTRLDSMPELFEPLPLQTLHEFYLGLADEMLRKASPPT